MWFIWWDPCSVLCWLFGQFVTWGVNYGLYVVVFNDFFAWSPAGIAHFIVFEFLIALIVISHFRALLTDPGSVKRNTVSLEHINTVTKGPVRVDGNGVPVPKPRYCKICLCMKPSRAHHCSTCDRCIMKMDHHCPWVGNCVGQNNMKYFLQYVLSVFTGGLYAFCLFAYKAAYCYQYGHRSCRPHDVFSMVLWGICAIAAVMFSIFTSCMFCDQYEGMTTNTTGIEAMKGWHEESIPIMKGMATACGEPLSWRWFIPVDVPPSARYEYNPDVPEPWYDNRDPAVVAFYRKIQQNKEQAEREAALSALATDAGSAGVSIGSVGEDSTDRPSESVNASFGSEVDGGGTPVPGQRRSGKQQQSAKKPSAANVARSKND